LNYCSSSAIMYFEVSYVKLTNTAARLKEIMSERNLRQIDIVRMAQPFCKKYGIKLGKNDMSQYISGKVVPGQEKLTILGLTLDVSEAWLMGYDINRNRTPDSAPSGLLPLPANKSYPLVGDIACGTPILAEENIAEYIQFPGDLSADFCLRCHGDSMIDARILDGDIVFIRKQPEVSNGEIAAVLIGEEATLKRVYYTGDTLTLMSANPAYAPRVYTGEQLENVRILGRAVSFLSAVK